MRIKVGDRVDILYQGTVRKVEGERYWIEDDPFAHRADLRTGMQSISVIEPEYEKGAVYQDAKGALYYRVNSPGGPWRNVDTTVLRAEYTPLRPLRKLVPEEA